MQCPKCKGNNCKYLDKRISDKKYMEQKMPKISFKARCSDCGWEGEIYTIINGWFLGK